VLCGMVRVTSGANGVRAKKNRQVSGGWSSSFSVYFARQPVSTADGQG
jgi:hypothetical protein